MCWYLPKNMAGTVTGDDAVDSEKKKTGKGISNATYIELTGEAVQGGVTYKNVTFRFYPGSDQNNYDIIRNSHYTVNVTLVGIDVSDERITVGEIPPVEFDTEKMPAEKGGEKKVQITARPGQEWSFDMPQWLSALIEGKTVSGGATVAYQGPYQLTFQAMEANPRAEDRSVDFPVHINGEDQKVTITQSASSLSTTDAISLAATADATSSSSFTATKGLLWDATLSESWLSWAADNLSTSGNAEGSSQILKVRSNSPNPLATGRSGKITVKAGASIIEADYDGLRKEINVTQAASTVIGSTKEVSAETHKDLKSSFTATLGLNWTASVTDGSWINLSTPSGGPTTDSAESLTYNVAINPNADSRTGYITVRAGDKTFGPTGEITVTQKGSLFSATGPIEMIDTIAGSQAYGSVTATEGLPWTIYPTTDNDITVSPDKGSGNADLTFTATTANTGAERTGTFIVSVIGTSSDRSTEIKATQAAGINNIVTINDTIV
ncbi:MAG: hypothetical protein LUD46_05470 [Parabacteroides sp.]|nr:hypothetical protein [Parabacteroides sp.]